MAHGGVAPRYLARCDIDEGKGGEPKRELHGENERAQHYLRRDREESGCQRKKHEGYLPEGVARGFQDEARKQKDDLRDAREHAPYAGSEDLHKVVDEVAGLPGWARGIELRGGFRQASSY